jgi:O26-antigen biosynthesis N-acetyl-L-fucosamine transferase
MKIVLFSDYYYPIVKSGSIVISDLAKELTARGHEAIVITFNDNQSEKLTDTIEDGIRIVRIKTKLRAHGMIGRLLAEIRYSAMIINGLKELHIPSIDGLISYSPSIFYSKAITWLKKRYGIKTYLIVRDIFPKWLLDAGILKKGPLYFFFKSEEKKLYKSVDFIGIESKKDLDYFKKYLSGETLLEVLDNWGSSIDLNQIKNQRSQFLLENKVNIIYGGNMGDAQDLYTLLSNIDDSLLDGKAMLTLIGNGHQVERIKSLIDVKNFKNVQLLEEVSQKKYLSILNEADIGLVSLNSNLKSNNFPLKMMGYIQQGKPILASVNQNNEIIEIIENSQIGKVSLAGDKEALNKNIALMINDKVQLKEQGVRALKVFNDRFTVNIAVDKILTMLEK